MTDDTVLICACGRVWRGIKVGQDADAELKAFKFLEASFNTELTRLRAIESRAGDVEGMAAVLKREFPGDVDSVLADSMARAVIDYAMGKEGG